MSFSLTRTVVFADKTVSFSLTSDEGGDEVVPGYEPVKVLTLDVPQSLEDQTPLDAIAFAENAGHDFDAICSDRGADDERRRADQFVSVELGRRLDVITVADYYCEYELEPQANAIGPETDLVVFTYGGNDLFFSSLVTKCLVSNQTFALATNPPDITGIDEAIESLPGLLAGSLFTNLAREAACEDQLVESERVIDEEQNLREELRDDFVRMLDTIRVNSSCNARAVWLSYPNIERDPNFTYQDIAVGERITSIARERRGFARRGRWHCKCERASCGLRRFCLLPRGDSGGIR